MRLCKHGARSKSPEVGDSEPKLGRNHSLDAQIVAKDPEVDLGRTTIEVTLETVRDVRAQCPLQCPNSCRRVARESGKPHSHSEIGLTRPGIGQHGPEVGRYNAAPAVLYTLVRSAKVDLMSNRHGRLPVQLPEKKLVLSWIPHVLLSTPDAARPCIEQVQFTATMAVCGCVPNISLFPSRTRGGEVHVPCMHISTRFATMLSLSLHNVILSLSSNRLAVA